jgi:hypothetical protein
MKFASPRRHSPELLGMDQSEVSRLERRSDMLLSTLERFVEPGHCATRAGADHESNPSGSCGSTVLSGTSTDPYTASKIAGPS